MGDPDSIEWRGSGFVFTRSTDSKRGICSYHGVWIAWSARWLGLCSVSVIPGAKGSKHFVLARSRSNTETVLAKWLYGWILLPMTYFLIGWVAGGIIVLISSIGAAAMVSDTALVAEAMAIHGVGLASHAGTMMVQIWIAPFFAWSLLVSQWACAPRSFGCLVSRCGNAGRESSFDVAWLTDWFWSRANVSAEMMSSESVQSVQLGLG